MKLMSERRCATILFSQAREDDQVNVVLEKLDLGKRRKRRRKEESEARIGRVSPDLEGRRRRGIGVSGVTFTVSVCCVLGVSCCSFSPVGDFQVTSCPSILPSFHPSSFSLPQHAPL
ncbi:hypothetical protein BDW69DRAFT_38610 [Aspergillus filifer]